MYGKTRVLVIVGIIASFVIGYFNQELGVFFLNKDALIGCLLATAIAYFLYSQHLEKKVLRLRNENDVQYQKLEAANSKIWNRKELKTVLADRIKEIHTSIQLRDGILKNIRTELGTQISNMKHDILLEMQKHVKTVSKK